jgi:nucleotide-binding universal stress UspA family protein
MKSILLHIHGDKGTAARREAALALCRATGAHLTCLQVSPYADYIAGDSFGGIYVLEDVFMRVEQERERLRQETHAALASEDVVWDYEALDGDPARTLIARSALADLVVVSRTVSAGRLGDPMPLAGDIALSSSVPVLAVPVDFGRFDPLGPALIAWNGGAQAGAALKAAAPLLRLAASVTLLSAGDTSEWPLPPEAAARYLARHGIEPRIHNTPAVSGPVSEALIAQATAMGAAYVAMGAYGHSRAREYLLGGETRRMLSSCPVPLLLAH